MSLKNYITITCTLVQTKKLEIIIKTIIIISIILFKVLLFAKGTEERSMVAGDNVNIRSAPTIKSEKVFNIRILTPVTVIKKSGKKEKIGKLEGEWIFIDTGYKENPMSKDTIKGWIFDYYLTSNKDFKKLNEFNNYKISGWYGGEIFYLYKFFKDAHCEAYGYESDGKTLKLKFKGHVFSFRNIIAIVRDDGEFYSHFFLNSNGQLCYPEADEQGNDVCSRESYK